MPLPFPRISPEILSLGPVTIRWYGVMYVVGYLVGFQLARRRIRQGRVAMTLDDLDAWIAYLVVGMLLGARLLYAVVYHPGHYLDAPLDFHGELYGRPTSLPWGMVFPADPLGLPRHPSQLYEGVAEGIVLFALLWIVDRWARRHDRYRPGLLAAVFLVGYGVLRFLIEFTREPDAQLGFVVGSFSAGQLLSAVMIVAGTALAAFLYRSRRPGYGPAGP